MDNKAERLSLSEIQNYEKQRANEFLLQRADLGSTLRDFTPPIVDLQSWPSGVLDLSRHRPVVTKRLPIPLFLSDSVYMAILSVSPLHIECGSGGR